MCGTRFDRVEPGPFVQQECSCYGCVLVLPAVEEQHAGDDAPIRTDDRVNVVESPARILGRVGTRGKRRQDRIHAITFNAWRYGGGEDIKRALLRHAFLELGRILSAYVTRMRSRSSRDEPPIVH